MQIPTDTLECVGYIAEEIGGGQGVDITYDHAGTGFFVSMESGVPGIGFEYFVTAKHLMDDMAPRQVAIIVNQVGGGTTRLSELYPAFYTHPSDPTADVAVIPASRSKVAHKTVPITMFAMPEMLQDGRLGIGDDVFFPGLFSFAPGSTKVTPLVRFGNLAMVPDGQIQIGSGFADTYLIEARSIGGMSGSPVFIFETIHEEVPVLHDGNRIPRQTQRKALGSCWLLGLTHGHWDIPESDLDDYQLRYDRRHGVNMGIGVVVPAIKILETLQQPELIELRKIMLEEYQKVQYS